MAPISPGFQLAPARKAKKPTASTNLHRFESFTKRIARLKIDPVHTVERRKPSNNDSDLLQSYFRTSLEEWAELNLSQTFTSFLAKASPLCENLPQLLHHANTIFELLVQHIEKRDALSLEPLVSLLAHFAHDLGHNFEQYFSRTVMLVTQVAASDESAEVVEWCFTCLAWMFKYLSKLLVQDLRPLLDIMTPYLSSRKEYIVRFSAESLAFLLRKAAVLYQKKKDPLNLAMKHLLNGYSHDRESTSLLPYQVGVMTLCVESARGIDGQLHSCSKSLVRCLLYTAAPMNEQQEVRSTVEGIMIALVHETNSSTGFQPIVEATLDSVSNCVASKEAGQIFFALRLLTVIIGTRKGSRIASWADVIQTFLDVAAAAGQSGTDKFQMHQELVTLIAGVIQFAPMNQLLPFLQKLLDLAARGLSTREYFSFCTACAELGEERFIDLVLPRFQQYIATHWSDDEVALYYSLEKLGRGKHHIGESTSDGLFTCSEELKVFVIQQLSKETAKKTAAPVELLAGRIHLACNLRLAPNSESTESLLDTYLSLIINALEEPSIDPNLRRRTILGWGFQTFLDNASRTGKRPENLPLLVLDSSPAHFRLPSFLHAATQLFQTGAGVGEMNGRSSDNVRNVLIQNLLSTSSRLKQESLHLLRLLASPDAKKWVSETIDLMLDILGTPYTPAEARKIAMLLRRLPQRHSKISSESPFQDFIPWFCLGLLSHYHDQTRKEVCSVLAQMMETTHIEESVFNVAIQWLQAAPDIDRPLTETQGQPKSRLSAFECSNLSHIESLCSEILQDFRNCDDRLRSLAEDDNRLEYTRTPESGRMLALQVLSAIPASAERRSRLLVPIFLAAPMNRGQLHQNPNSDASMSSHTLSPDLDDHEWSLPDRKALLSLFGKFVNPRVLFRSGEVYEKLIDLLSNGNTEIRKLALQAILTWKHPVLTQYETTLLHLAEEKLTTTALGALFNLDGEEVMIKLSDRSTVLPVLLRLVFGLIVGRAGTTGSQEGRRKSILRALFRSSEHEIALFLQIALGKLNDIKLDGTLPNHMSLDQLLVPEDQQYGFLRLLLSMLETLQSQFAPYGQQVVDAVVSCVIKASRQSHAIVKPNISGGSLSRSIRRTGFQCLVHLFEYCQNIDWRLYLPVLFTHAISPRLEIFASETSQGISGLLRLFASWTHSNDLVGNLGEYDKRLPDVLFQCLTVPSTPKDVKLFVLKEIVLPWTELAEDGSIKPNRGHELLQTESDGLLRALMALLEQTPPREILNSITSILPVLASLVKSSGSRLSITRLLARLLRDPAFKLPPNVKSQLLLAIHSFLANGEDFLDENSQTELLELVSSLFNYFKDESNRQVLCQVLARLSRSSQILAQAAQLCSDLNAVSLQRLEEIDYDRRLQAFQSIRSLEVDGTNQIFWQPIVYNLLFFVRTSDDFSIRSNAMSCLKQFIVKACEVRNPELNELVNNSVLPACKKCIRQESELVRADFVSLLGLVIQNVRENEELANMTPLLVGNDDEASFFSNILHIQQHRRLRAIRRLISEVERGAISSQNNAEIFIPLLEMFVRDSSSDESAQSTKGQSIVAMSSLLQWIDWKQFKTHFRRYKNEVGGADSDQRATSRLLGHAADALLSAQRYRLKSSVTVQEGPVPHLAKSLPINGTVEQELRNQFIPKLAELIHYKDEAEISFRLPIAVTTIKLTTMLPSEELHIAAAPIILDMAQILRSRAQESRDATRHALCQIVMLLGPSSLQFVLKEIRTALTRGYQLHVVSYTLHAILVAISPSMKHGDLDYCCEELVSVIMDDIFGAVGQEKDNQDYVSTMKEVKSSKSYDSMELLAKSISVSSVMKLVAPIQTLLSGSLTSKQVRQTDELLRRIGSGLSQNPTASKRDTLTFAYQLIQAIYQQKENTPVATPTNDEKNRQRYLVQLSSAHKATTSQSSVLLYKLARFALDLVRSTLQKSTDILTAENVHGFLPIIGDALIEGQEDVKISALRLLSAIIKLPMPELEQNASIYVSEAVKLVKNSTSTNEEGAQAALKLVAAILREQKSVKVRDSDIADLLHRISPDIEEPDRQGVTFNFIRAVMARKIQLPEIYELADKIGIMMVTNQTKGARDVARGVYVHFLLEYPQSSSRWSKQQKFLLKNLEYDYPEGRQSVMEAINTLVAKVKGEASQELVSTFFIPILLRMANDDNKGSRELAGALLSQLFRLASRDQLNELLQPLRLWVEQEDNRALQRVSMQAYGVLLDTEIALNREEIGHIRDNIVKTLRRRETKDEGEWELQFQTLVLLLKLTEAHPDTILNQKQTPLWSSVWASLRHHNGWIQSTSATLVCEFFKHCISMDLSKVPLTCDQGLCMEAEDFLAVLRSSVRVLKHTEGNKNLSTQMVQILLFLGQCMDMNGLTMDVTYRSGTNEKEDEQQGSSSDEDEVGRMRQIPAMQYLLDQITRILRVETASLTSTALLPKEASLTLLTNLLPSLSLASLPKPCIHDILLPIQHLTDPSTIPPHSADPTFAASYQTLIELSHEVMEKLQQKLGDTEYVKALTEVSKIMRERREGRRTKRRIERVADPERAAREKKRKSDRQKERQREMGRAQKKRRVEGGM